MFVWGQIIGILALIMLIVSFQINNKHTLLRLQIVSSILYGAQYFCLSAYSGCLMSVVSMLRNFIFNRYYGKKVPVFWLILFLLVMLILGILTSNTILQFIPVFLALVYSTALWVGNLRTIRFVEVGCALLYIAYNFGVQAYTGFIASIFELVFALIAVYRFDIRKRDSNV